MALHSFLELKVGFLEYNDINAIVQNLISSLVIAAINEKNTFLTRWSLISHLFLKCRAQPWLGTETDSEIHHHSIRFDHLVEVLRHHNSEFGSCFSKGLSSNHFLLPRQTAPHMSILQMISISLTKGGSAKRRNSLFMHISKRIFKKIWT